MHGFEIAGKMIAPVYEQLSRDFPDVRFYKVDIDKDQVSSSVAASNVSAVVRPCCEAHSRRFRHRFPRGSVGQPVKRVVL